MVAQQPPAGVGLLFPRSGPPTRGGLWPRRFHVAYQVAEGLCKSCSGGAGVRVAQKCVVLDRHTPPESGNPSQRREKVRSQALRASSRSPLSRRNSLRLACSRVGAPDNLGEARAAANRIHPRIPQHHGRAVEPLSMMRSSKSRLASGSSRRASTRAVKYSPSGSKCL